jgi:hypothetical protein
VVGLLLGSLVMLAPEAGAGSRKPTPATKKKKPPPSKFVNVKVKGTVYRLTEAQAALVRALPDDLDQLELWTTTIGVTTIHVYLKRLGEFPVFCVDTKSVDANSKSSSGGCSTNLPWGQIDYVTSQSVPEGNLTVVAGPVDAAMVAHSKNGDVALTRMIALPSLKVGFFSYTGAELTPFGIAASSPPGVRPFLPSVTSNRADKLNPRTLYSETDNVGSVSLVSAQYGPQEVFCTDTGKETFDVCFGAGNHQSAFPLYSDSKERTWTYEAYCRSQVARIGYASSEGAKPTDVKPLPIDHPTYLIIKRPRTGVLTVTPKTGRAVVIDLAELEGWGAISGYYRITSALGDCP